MQMPRSQGDLNVEEGGACLIRELHEKLVEARLGQASLENQHTTMRLRLASDEQSHRASLTWLMRMVRDEQKRRVKAEDQLTQFKAQVATSAREINLWREELDLGKARGGLDQIRWKLDLDRQASARSTAERERDEARAKCAELVSRLDLAEETIGALKASVEMKVGIHVCGFKGIRRLAAQFVIGRAPLLWAQEDDDERQ